MLLREHLGALPAFARDGMKILAGQIRRQLRLESGKYGHCAIYEHELQRIWPMNEENRKAKIEKFAKEQGFRLAYYKQGLCAIFEGASADVE